MEAGPKHGRLVWLSEGLSKSRLPQLQPRLTRTCGPFPGARPGGRTDGVG